jgi:hypothetical protein
MVAICLTRRSDCQTTIRPSKPGQGQTAVAAKTRSPYARPIWAVRSSKSLIGPPRRSARTVSASVALPITCSVKSDRWMARNHDRATAWTTALSLFLNSRRTDSTSPRAMYPRHSRQIAHVSVPSSRATTKASAAPQAGACWNARISEFPRLAKMATTNKPRIEHVSAFAEPAALSVTSTASSWGSSWRTGPGRISLPSIHPLAPGPTAGASCWAGGGVRGAGSSRKPLRPLTARPPGQSQVLRPC